MAFQEKILGQNRPSNSDNTTIYTVPALTTSIITTFHVCNTSTNNSTFRIFIHDTGNTYNKSTAMYYDVPIQANETIQIQTHVGMNTAGGTIGIRSSSPNTLTFTLNGVEIT